ncbi:MAG: hypothetical protein ACQERR_07580 [Pseudomonadota bacterium]
MRYSHTKKGQVMRLRLAQEAARLIDEHGLRDYQHAKRKAAEHLGAPETHHLPSNAEVEEALAEHHRLFLGERHAAALARQRRAAVEAMALLEGFQPRLVGSVLSGTAGEHTNITLHVFTDTPEELAFRLFDHHLPFTEGEARVNTGHRGERQEVTLPTFGFFAGDEEIELVVFPLKGLRQPPASPVDGRPMERATPEEVAGLLGSDPA